MMTIHRFVYKVCWRNRVILPIMVILGTCLTVFHAPSEQDNTRETNISVRSNNDGSLVAPKQNILKTEPVAKSQNEAQRKHKLYHKFKSYWKGDVYYNESNPPELFGTWQQNKMTFCSGDFVGYSNEFAILHNVVIDKNYCISQRKGGEKIDAVLNQTEKAEYYTYNTGCFQLACKNKPSYKFNPEKNHMNNWLQSFQTQNIQDSDVIIVKREFVIVVLRYEYANFYHTMADWYNAFLLMQFFNKTQFDTNIVLFDAHPQSSLDYTWPHLFNTSQRAFMLPKQTLFKSMAWNIRGYDSPFVNHMSRTLPLVEEFRHFFLSSYALPDSHQLDCGYLNIMFVWRRDYVAHPRKPSGIVSRKINNERELMKSVQEKYPKFHIRGVQIDIFKMQEQLALASTTDILIGMHGAGLTHTLFLPKHAGLIELLPNYIFDTNNHFYAIARWRSLLYKRWANKDRINEIAKGYTNVPPKVVLNLLETVLDAMCHNNGTLTTF